MSDKPSFFSELKRRHVYKVAGAYAVVAWLLMQAASILFPTFGAPAWVMKVFVAVIILGFPIALVVAWAFELTPEGIKRTEDLDRTPQQQSRNHAWIFVVIIAGAMSAGLFFLGRFTAANKQSGSAGLPTKSIAVLPFESLSEDRSNAYFADGIQDEILARLSKIADLKVISRTSTQKYKSAPDNLREIAQELGVANILEGTVQKAGDQVRITVQLINALKDDHLWADTYDRKMTDIFGVESDVAQKIAGSLEAKLTGREKKEIASGGTTNPQAYDALLHALALRNSQTVVSIAAGEKQIEFSRRAIELDPNYADAWASLAIAQANKFRTPWQSEELEKSTRDAAETALRLAPDSPKAHQAMGLYYRYCRKDNRAALAELEIARAGAPNDASILSNLGALQRAQGKVEESLQTLRKAADLDPLNAQAWVGLGETYSGLRKFDQARSMLDRALAIVPDDFDILAAKASTYQDQGNLDASWKILSSHPFPPPNDWTVLVYHEQYLLWRDYGALLETINTWDLAHENLPPMISAAVDVMLANLYFLNQQRDLARSHAEKAQRQMQALRAQKFWEPEISGSYIECAARFGNRDEMEREIEFLFAQTRDNQWLFPGSQYFAAAGYALLGDLDKALPLLRDSLAKPGGTTTAHLRLNPVWDGVRDDPRFQKLLDERP
jgi:TolB-like protein/Flp pilus assembly protein TadD